MTATALESHVRLTPRDYQEAALAKVAEAEQRGVRSLLGVAATGLGKTVVFCTLAERRGGRTLVLAHRDELVTQAAAKVLEIWPDLGASANVLQALHSAGLQHVAKGVHADPRGVGIIKGSANDTRARVVIASVQTLARVKRLGQLVASYDDQGPLSMPSEPFDLCVVDEAHHAAAESYKRVLGVLHAGDDDGPLLFGVTATPVRGDGKGLDDLFDEVAFNYDVLWGIQHGYLSDLRGLAVKVDGFDTTDVKVNRGDFDQGQAGAQLEQAHADHHIVAAWEQHAAGRKTLAFTPTVATAQLLAARYNQRGIPAGVVHGGTPELERRQTLQAFSRGDLRVLTNCAVLTEGYDEPTVDCVVIARPTRSQALYVQMVGRGTRRHPDKVDCLVLDVVGASEDHSLVVLPSLFGVERKFRQRLQTGDGTASSVVAEYRDEEVRLGRLRAEEVELFTSVRSQGVAWVALHDEGDELRRYVRPLGLDAEGKPLPTVVLAQRVAGEDVWVAGLQMPDGAKRVLLADSTLELAQGVGEDYCRKNGARALVDADAPWRKRKPSPKALAAAAKWRLPNPEQYATHGELSEALDAHITRIKMKR